MADLNQELDRRAAAKSQTAGRWSGGCAVAVAGQWMLLGGVCAVWIQLVWANGFGVHYVSAAPGHTVVAH